MQTIGKNLLNKPGRALLLSAFLPILFVIIVVGRYGFTVPWLDEYNHIIQLVRLHLDGELSLEKIGMQVGDHRLFFPFLLSLIFVDISGGNTAFELGFSILLMLMSLYLVYRIYKLQHPGEEHALYFLIPCAFLLFSLGQHDNWIWGNQKCIFMMLACVYVAAWSLERFPRSKRAFVIGVSAAVVASWSFLSGNVLWLVIPIALWLNGYRKISTYLIWIGIAGIHFLLFFNGYVHRPFGGSQGGLADRFYILYHMLAYIGGPFSPETHFILEQYSNHALIPSRTTVAQIMGLVGVLLLGVNGVYAIFVRKMRLREFSSWSLLIGFGLANGVSLTLGRSGEVIYALASRYITLAIPLWIGILAFTFANVSHVVRNRSSLRWYARGLVIFNIVTLVIITTGYGANLNRMIEGRETFKEVMELCYLTRLSGDPRCVMTQFFYNGAPSGQPFIADLVAFLQEHHMYISEEPSITSNSSDLGNNVGVGLTRD